MIPPSWRFYTTEGALFPGGPHTWTVIDWDQRRWIAVTGPADTLPDEESGEEMVSRHMDHLALDVLSFNVSADGELESVSKDAEDDPTWEIRYPDYPGHKKEGEVIRRSELQEVDRLHVCTDLVEYKKEAFAFKYTIFQQRIKNVWDELHILKALRGHDSFVSFHRVVIDDVSEKVLGFTSQYVTGGLTLEDYHGQPFYFRWLNQLTDAIDDLNLRFGIMHQDVAPRNVLVEPASSNLKIFDFDRSARIGSPEQMPGRGDVDGVIFTVYETLTKDEHYREVPFDEQEVAKVQALEEWKLDKVPLEDGKGGIAAYRSFLDEWAHGRRTTRKIRYYSEATDPISWPEYQEPELIRKHSENGPLDVSRRRRNEVQEAGGYVTCWERPPHRERYPPPRN